MRRLLAAVSIAVLATALLAAVLAFIVHVCTTASCGDPMMTNGIAILVAVTLMLAILLIAAATI